MKKVFSLFLFWFLVFFWWKLFFYLDNLEIIIDDMNNQILYINSNLSNISDLQKYEQKIDDLHQNIGKYDENILLFGKILDKTLINLNNSIISLKKLDKNIQVIDDIEKKSKNELYITNQILNSKEYKWFQNKLFLSIEGINNSFSILNKLTFLYLVKNLWHIQPNVFKTLFEPVKSVENIQKINKDMINNWLGKSEQIEKSMESMIWF